MATQPRVRPSAAPATKAISQVEIAKLVHKKQDEAEARGEYMTTAAATTAVYQELGISVG